MIIQTEARNATLADLAQLLQDQHTRKVDVVAPASQVRFENGQLHVRGTEAELTDDGVTTAEGVYRPTTVFDEGLADKLGIPLAYVRRMRLERPDLYDGNANGWLHGSLAIGHTDGAHNWVEERPGAEADPRRFMLRLFRGDDGEGVARAMLSDSYKRVDNLDVLTAALDGARQAGTDVQVEGCDLTERRMSVRLVAPSITALAPVLLDGYRNPFRDPAVDAQRQGSGWTLQRGLDAAAREGQGYDGQEPIVWAGLVLGNSETGGGAFTITPRMVVKVCRNGLVITEDMLRSVHLGAKLDEGVVRWTDDTQAKNLALVTAKTRDAVATFLDADYMTKVIARIEQDASTPLAAPADVVQTVGKKLAFSEDVTAGVLDHFIRGGQTTAGGVLQAVTSYAQTVADPDAAQALEAQGVKAMQLAASA